MLVRSASLEANVCRAFLPAEKKYLEVPADDFRSMSNDPFIAASFISATYDKKNEGTEEISGYACDKVVTSTQGQLIMTQWTSPKLGFLLKTSQTAGDDARALNLTMTAGDEPVKGTIRLERADRFSSNLEVDLAAGEMMKWTVALDQQTATVSFNLSAGSAKVVLDQSG